MNNEPINNTIPAAASAQPKHSHHKAKLVIIFVVVFLIGAGTGFCINQFLLSKGTSQQETASDENIPQPTATADTTSVNTKFASSESDKAVLSVVAELEKVGNSQMTITEGQAMYSADSLTTYDYTYPYYLDEQSQVATMLEKSYGLYYNYGSDDTKWSEKGDRLSDVMTKKLKELGFTSYKIDVMGAENEYINSQTGIICNSVSHIPYHVVCGHTSWISEEKLSLVRDLAKAADLSYTDADPADITDSSVAPYQRLYAGVSNAVGLFYRTSPDSELIFIGGTQEAVSCDEFDAEARKAFAGEQCYDYEKEEAVTL